MKPRRNPGDEDRDEARTSSASLELLPTRTVLIPASWIALLGTFNADEPGRPHETHVRAERLTDWRDDNVLIIASLAETPTSTWVELRAYRNDLYDIPFANLDLHGREIKDGAVVEFADHKVTLLLSGRRNPGDEDRDEARASASRGRFLAPRVVEIPAPWVALVNSRSARRAPGRRVSARHRTDWPSDGVTVTADLVETQYSMFVELIAWRGDTLLADLDLYQSEVADGEVMIFADRKVTLKLVTHANVVIKPNSGDEDRDEARASADRDGLRQGDQVVLDTGSQPHGRPGRVIAVRGAEICVFWHPGAASTFAAPAVYREADLALYERWDEQKVVADAKRGLFRFKFDVGDIVTTLDEDYEDYNFGVVLDATASHAWVAPLVDMQWPPEFDSNSGRWTAAARIAHATLPALQPRDPRNRGNPGDEDRDEARASSTREKTPQELLEIVAQEVPEARAVFRDLDLTSWDAKIPKSVIAKLVLDVVAGRLRTRAAHDGDTAVVFSEEWSASAGGFAGMVATFVDDEDPDAPLLHVLVGHVDPRRIRRSFGVRPALEPFTIRQSLLPVSASRSWTSLAELASVWAAGNFRSVSNPGDEDRDEARASSHSVQPQPTLFMRVASWHGESKIVAKNLTSVGVERGELIAQRENGIGGTYALRHSISDLLRNTTETRLEICSSEDTLSNPYRVRVLVDKVVHEGSRVVVSTLADGSMHLGLEPKDSSKRLSGPLPPLAWRASPHSFYRDPDPPWFSPRSLVPVTLEVVGVPRRKRNPGDEDRDEARASSKSSAPNQFTLIEWIDGRRVQNTAASVVVRKDDVMVILPDNSARYPLHDRHGFEVAAADGDELVVRAGDKEAFVANKLSFGCMSDHGGLFYVSDTAGYPKSSRGGVVIVPGLTAWLYDDGRVMVGNSGRPSSARKFTADVVTVSARKKKTSNPSDEDRDEARASSSPRPTREVLSDVDERTVRALGAAGAYWPRRHNDPRWVKDFVIDWAMRPGEVPWIFRGALDWCPDCCTQCNEHPDLPTRISKLPVYGPTGTVLLAGLLGILETVEGNHQLAGQIPRLLTEARRVSRTLESQLTVPAPPWSYDDSLRLLDSLRADAVSDEIRDLAPSGTVNEVALDQREAAQSLYGAASTAVYVLRAEAAARAEPGGRRMPVEGVNAFRNFVGRVSSPLSDLAAVNQSVACDEFRLWLSPWLPLNENRRPT